MSAQAEAWVERYSPARGATYTVHKAIAELVNEQRHYQFYGALVTLAKRIRLSRKTVGRAIDDLVGMGLLEVVRAPFGEDGMATGRPGVYRFVFVDGLAVQFDGHGGETSESVKHLRPGGESIDAPPASWTSSAPVVPGPGGESPPSSPDPRGGESIDAPVSRSTRGCVNRRTGESIDARTEVQLQPTTPNGTEDLAPAVPAPARARDPIWDALIDCWQLDASELTKPERARINTAAKALRDIGADPGEIPARRQMYGLLFPHAAQTMLALVNRWAECRPDPGRLPGRAPRAAGSIARAVARGA